MTEIRPWRQYAEEEWARITGDPLRPEGTDAPPPAAEPASPGTTRWGWLPLLIVFGLALVAAVARCRP